MHALINTEKLNIVAVIIYVTFLSSPALAGCHEASGEYERRDKICLVGSMHQYRCDYIKSKGVYVWTFVQKLSLKSSLRDEVSCSKSVNRSSLVTTTRVR